MTLAMIVVFAEPSSGCAQRCPPFRQCCRVKVGFLFFIQDLLRFLLDTLGIAQFLVRLIQLGFPLTDGFCIASPSVSRLFDLILSGYGRIKGLQASFVPIRPQTPKPIVQDVFKALQFRFSLRQVSH